MLEAGKVINAEGKNMTVRFGRKTECEKCRMCVFSKDSLFLDMKLENTVGAKEGDIIEVSMAGKYVLLSSIIVYIIPLFFTAAGLIAGFKLWGQGIALLTGLIFLVLGFITVSFAEKYMKKRKCGLVPQAVRVIETANKQ